jgi:uncharacterized surface protein with fasciclin (FAS1) repeats
MHIFFQIKLYKVWISAFYILMFVQFSNQNIIQMNYFLKSYTLLATLLCLLSFNAFSQTVFDIIENSPEHNTLEAAIVAAGLDETLASEGPFTVFAPTDEAFSLIPADVIATLLADPTGLLTQILLNHVVSGTTLSTDLSDGMMITTLQGGEVMVSINDGVVMIGNATVIVADLQADNGVVHVIDAVIETTVNNITEFNTTVENDIYLYSVDITGREINFNTTNTIVFDIYKSGKTVKRFVEFQ